MHVKIKDPASFKLLIILIKKCFFFCSFFRFEYIFYFNQRRRELPNQSSACLVQLFNSKIVINPTIKRNQKAQFYLSSK